MSKVLAAAALVFAAGTVYGEDEILTMTHFLMEVDNTSADADIPGFSGMYDTYDLMVEVTGGDDWSSTAAEATTDMLFWDSTPDADGPQDAFWSLPGFAPLEYDSFYSLTPNWGVPGFAGAVVNDPSFKAATWFDTPPNGGEGIFTLARYTVEEGGSLRVLGTSTSVLGGATLDSFDLFIPAPSTAALLGLGGLLARRRR